MACSITQIWSFGREDNNSQFLDQLQFSTWFTTLVPWPSIKKLLFIIPSLSDVWSQKMETWKPMALKGDSTQIKDPISLTWNWKDFAHGRQITKQLHL